MDMAKGPLKWCIVLALLACVVACAHPSPSIASIPARNVLPAPPLDSSPVGLPSDAYAYDLRSDPAQALADIERGLAQAKLQNDALKRARWLFDKARAVASGGDYARAIRIAEEGAAWGDLPPTARFVLADAVRLWRRLRLSSDGISNDSTDDGQEEMMQLVLEAWPALDSALDEPEQAACTKMRALQNCASLLPNAEVLATSGAQTTKAIAPENLLALLCGSAARVCPLRDLINVHLLTRAQLLDRARASTQEQQNQLKAAGDERTAAVFEMLEADLLSAPNSSPLMLNLSPFKQLHSTTLQISAGLKPSEYATVDPNSMARARTSYGHAGAVFARSGFRRGLAQLEARKGYLAFADSHFDVSAQLFSDASRHLEEAGDVVASLWSDMGTIASWLALDNHEHAEAMVLTLAERTHRLQLPGVASAEVRLLTDLAQFLEVQRGHAHAAASAKELAAVLASRAEIPLAALGASYAAADYKLDLGRVDEAVRLYQKVLADADALRRAAQDTIAVTPAAKWSRESRLRTIDMNRLLALSSLKSAYVRIGDARQARYCNAALRKFATTAENVASAMASVVAGSDPSAPPAQGGRKPATKPYDSDEGDWSLLTAEGRMTEAIAAARSAHDRTGEILACWASGERARAKLVARSLAESFFRALNQPISARGGASASSKRAEREERPLPDAVSAGKLGRMLGEARRTAPDWWASNIDLLQRQSDRQNVEMAISILVVVEEYALARRLWQLAEPSADAAILFKQPGKEWERDLTLADIGDGLGEARAAEALYQQALAKFEKLVSVITYPEGSVAAFPHED